MTTESITKAEVKAMRLGCDWRECSVCGSVNIRKDGEDYWCERCRERGVELSEYGEDLGGE